MPTRDDTQHYSCCEDAAQHTEAPALTHTIETNEHDVEASVPADGESDSEWAVDDTYPAGSSETVGECLLFPRLETSDHHVVFQAGDSIRRGRSVMIFLGAVHVGTQTKLLCVSSRAGSVAKTVPLRHYTKIASSAPTLLCHEALAQWIQSKSKLTH